MDVMDAAETTIVKDSPSLSQGPGTEALDVSGATSPITIQNQRALTDAELHAGILLNLRSRFFTPFEALSYVSTSITEQVERKMSTLKVGLIQTSCLTR